MLKKDIFRGRDQQVKNTQVLVVSLGSIWQFCTST
jgi:hypothetical protein